MNEWMLLGIGIYLVVVALIDWRAKAIPSVMMSAGLIFALALNPQNLFYGVLSFTLAYLLYEADFFSGVADIKVFAMMGMLIPSFEKFMIFVLIFAILGMGWKIAFKIRHPKQDECPFLPVFVLIFIALTIGRVI